MNQNIVNYLQENKGKYAQDVLIGQLKTSGYSDADIVNGVAAVYGSTDGTVVPTPITPIKYAGFWDRYAASFIDGIILLVPVIIINTVFTALSMPMLEEIAVWAVCWAYYILMTEKYQATFGKKAIGIKVISEKSENLTLKQIILRETVGKLLAMITIIGGIMVAFTGKKQGLHDMIADTLVVRNDPNKKTPTWIVMIIMAMPVITMLGLVALIAWGISFL